MRAKTRGKGSIVAALDIGSSKIACLIARALDEDGAFEVVGMGHQAAAGIRGGTVVDIDAAEAAIREAVHAAENMAADTLRGYPLREVVVNVPGVHVQGHHLAVDIQILGHAVTENDIRRALVKAQEKIASHDTELVHTVPTFFAIDGHPGVRDPRGMFGQLLEVDIHLLAARADALKNIAACIERSHLDIAALGVSSYAAGLSSLVEDEMDLGCTVVDIGGGVTSIAVFHGGSVIYSSALALGGQHVTADIARGLTTSIADAERIKILYGSAIAAGSDESELIDVPPIGEDMRSQPNHVPRSLLVGIIQPRLEEILEHIRARLDESGLGPLLPRRVVLTGGTSQMPGIRELAQHVLDRQVRLGRPIRVQGLPDAISGPAFATAAGLLTYLSERSHEMPARILARAEAVSLWDRTRLWLRENW